MPSPVEAIRVWRFADAPGWLQDLSTNGGDEDWIAAVPAVVDHQGELAWTPWVQHLDTCLEPQRIDVGELVVYIGSHA